MMIEKLTIHKSLRKINSAHLQGEIILADKINEVIDKLNKLTDGGKC